MPVPTPWMSLVLMIAISTAAWLVAHLSRRRLQTRLSALARESDMHYSASDRLTLAPRVAAHMPVIGAAAVRVRNVLYRSGVSGHVYIFTAEYTAGVVRAKKRVSRVATFTEPRDRTHRPPPQIKLAPRTGDIESQYRALLDQVKY